MSQYAFDEQIVVDLEMSDEGFSPRAVRLYVPGFPDVVEASPALRGRRFPSEVAAATAAVQEVKQAFPEILEHWARREGFL